MLRLFQQSYLILKMSINITHHINELMEVIYMLISMYTEKTFDKMQYPFYNKELENIKKFAKLSKYYPKLELDIILKSKY